MAPPSATKSPAAKKAPSQGSSRAASKATSRPRPTAKASSSKGEPSSAKTPTKKAATERATRSSTQKAAAPKKKPVVSTKKAPSSRQAPPAVAARGSKTSAPSDATNPLAVGALAPAFSLSDGAGKTVSSASLRGKPYVLYFYPKDNTPGCTQEACDFRDQYAPLRALGFEVLGVSPDSPKSHQGFAQKFQLPFPLLADEQKELAQAYGVWALKKNYGREFMGIVRSTFVVDAQGVIRAVFRGVRVPGHLEQVLAEAKKVSKL